MNPTVWSQHHCGEDLRSDCLVVVWSLGDRTQIPVVGRLVVVRVPCLHSVHCRTRKSCWGLALEEPPGHAKTVVHHGKAPTLASGGPISRRGGDRSTAHEDPGGRLGDGVHRDATGFGSVSHPMADRGRGLLHLVFRAPLEAQCLDRACGDAKTAPGTAVGIDVGRSVR